MAALLEASVPAARMSSGASRKPRQLATTTASRAPTTTQTTASRPAFWIFAVSRPVRRARLVHSAMPEKAASDGEHAVGGDDERAELEEARVH